MTAECFALLEKVTSLFGSNCGFIGDVFVFPHLSSRQADPMAGNFFCLKTVCYYLLQPLTLLAAFLGMLGRAPAGGKRSQRKDGM